ncbi:GTP cyclohydrolase I FolE [Oceanithermus profundus]|uniref:GTP cyclohydrolase 1 n=1 Tax=Oceanithermus profundus (strain DSM 14977 / NBRC 100410 / VKM B-2274 / 506) TaxID=670487 RepID=E4U9M4_OCEP5|nr:GTP cyclohydrolase I FolE [Oceanithermus profundus]ADR37188.1 GTP cyclohydrolase I [Oceanithermus profundus DSM 14977]
MKKRIELEDTGMTFETAYDLEAMSRLARSWLEQIGEDPAREGLADTPGRVARAWAFLTRGYQQSLEEVINGAVFEAEGSEMVVVKGIEFYSMCEHHLLPFFGQVHIGYIPDGKILGLSKFARLVDMYARRLQLQERLATQIAGALMQVLEPRGVGVVVEGAHLCMMMRGVEKQHSTTVTSAMRGVFKEDLKTREEFLALLRSQP